MERRCRARARLPIQTISLIILSLKPLHNQACALGRRSLSTQSTRAKHLERNGALAERCGVNLKVIELTCDDPLEHRRRVEQREWDLPELPQPTWAEVLARGYEPWHDPRLVLDGALSVDECVARAIEYVNADSHHRRAEA